VSGTRTVKRNSDSPNPQVRFAMYLVRWIVACTGRKHYRNLQTLAAATFVAAGHEPPAWVDRLEIDMNRRRKKRRLWARARMISAKH
jgi:hypothetical protein